MREAKQQPLRGLGLFCGTLTGWFGVLLIDIFTAILATGTGGAMSSADYTLGILIPLYVIIGLPIAMLICMIPGYVIWNEFERRKKSEIKHAVIAGGLLGAFLGGISFHLMGGIEVTVLKMADLTSTIFVGMISGFVAHHVAYKKRSAS